MLKRRVKGTRKFRKAETPHFSRAGAEWIGWNFASASADEEVARRHTEELSGTLGVYKWFKIRHLI
jgi:hypothetical protein